VIQLTNEHRRQVTAEIREVWRKLAKEGGGTKWLLTALWEYEESIKGNGVAPRLTDAHRLAVINEIEEIHGQTGPCRPVVSVFFGYAEDVRRRCSGG
jgi:hypothetical protein